MRHRVTGRLRAIGIALGIGMIGLPLVAQALGLGRLTVTTHLDEPLRGEIELLSPNTQELKTLKTSLASRSEFESAGIERLPHLFNIKYNVVQRGDRHYIVLTTDEPLREPYLQFLLQVEWSGGRLIREYTALLDPPTWVAGQPGEISAPPQAAEFTPSPSDVPTAQTAPASEAASSGFAPLPEPAPAPSPPPVATEKLGPPIAARSEPRAPAPAAEIVEAPQAQPESPAADVSMAPSPEPTWVGGESSWTGMGEYGPVKKGETLGTITQKIRTDKSVSAEQAMLALLRANPQAFFNNNVNNLKAGSILKIPDRNEVQAVSVDQARREFRAQFDSWQEYKIRLAAASQSVTVAEADPAPAEPPPAVKEPEKPKAAVKPKEEPAKPAPKEAAKPKQPAQSTAKSTEVSDDLLKIVRANLDDKNRSADTTKTPGVETSKGALSSEQQALRDRVATLEEAIESKDMQNKELSSRVGKMQDQVKNSARLIELENQELAKAQKQAAESLKEQEKKQQELAKAPTEAPPPAQPEPAPAPPPADVAPAKPPTETPAKPPTPAPAPPAVAQVESPSFLDSLTDSVLGNTMTLSLLGGVGVLGLGILGMYMVRRRRAHVEFEESILSGGSMNTDAASISDSGSQVAASDTSFLSDFSQGGMGNIHTDEVDPIAEAEVYLAYGRDEQAEEILKEAVVKDPGRHELKQKLLEIYHQRNDVRSFETLAEELYAALEGKGGRVWDKVEEMGRKISPNNPMFSGGAPRMAAREPATVLTSAPTGAFDATAALSSGNETQGLDFDSATDDFRVTPEPEASRSPSMDSGLDFDLGAPATTGSSASNEISFDMDVTADDDAPKKEKDSDALEFNIRGSDTVDTGILNFDTSSDDGGIDFSTSDTRGGDDGLSFGLDADSGSGELKFDTATETDTDAAGADELEAGAWDETATKLDLAKAYIDMGDAEGARSILDEVLAEGNESQKKQARELAAQIA